MISVIIPTLNEGQYLGRLLDELTNSSLIQQIIVSDGGSTDNTEEIAKSFSGLIWSIAKKGRAAQMNYGASLATQPILLFLHADSSLEKINFNAIPSALKNNLAGSFYLAFDKPGFFLSIYSYLSKINHPFFTYGDQGLFLYRKDFITIGGYADIEIMEDLEMVKRLRKSGSFIKLKVPIITSSRRFEKYGMVRQQFRNILLVFLYQLGFNPSFLSRFYKY